MEHEFRAMYLVETVCIAELTQNAPPLYLTRDFSSNAVKPVFVRGAVCIILQAMCQLVSSNAVCGTQCVWYTCVWYTMCYLPRVVDNLYD